MTTDSNQLNLQGHTSKELQTSTVPETKPKAFTNTLEDSRRFADECDQIVEEMMLEDPELREMLKPFVSKKAK